MRKTEQRLRTYFQKQNNNPEESQDSIRKTILLSELELKDRHTAKTTGFGTFLLTQMRMLGMRIWSVQIVMVLLVYLLLDFVVGIDLEYFTARKLAFITGILGVLMFSTAIPFLYRAQRYKMLEIEAGAKYSLGELVLSRILILGTGDIVMLFGMVWQIAKISPLTVLQTTFCLCLPFLLTLNGGMYLLRKIPFVHFRKWAYGMCIVICGILIGVTASCPAYYEMKFTFLVSGIIFLLIGSVIYQCAALFYGSGQVAYE